MAKLKYKKNNEWGEITIPSKTSQLSNDSGFLTQQDISGKADKATTLAGYGITNAYTKTEVDSEIEDATEVSIGDSEPQGNEIVWIDTSSPSEPETPKTLAYYGITDAYTKTEVNNKISSELSNYQLLINSSNKLESDLVDDTGQSNKFVTDNEKSAWDGKYAKPSGSIPKTDLSSEVQTSLGKADTAIQNVSDKEDVSNKITIWQNVPDNEHYPSEALVKASFTYIEEHYTKNPVLLYDKTNKMHVDGTINSGTDGVNGLINQAQGEGTSHDITSWNIEGMDLSAFRYIRVVFRRNNASYACTGEFNIPLDCDPVATRNLYVSGYTASVYGDRNRLLAADCAIDSAKSKFCVTQTVSLYETLVTVVDDLFIEKKYMVVID